MQKSLQDFTSITVLGFGLTGVSCARYLLSLGITPRIMDTRTHPPGFDQAPEIANACECHFGSLRREQLLQSDLIIVSPGIDRRHPEIQATAEAGILMVSDIELFAWVVDVPVIGITGSNGKSTVTELTGHILKQSGFSPAVAGNIGIPVLDYLTAHKVYDCFVLELSSFQLELISSLKLRAATILNISSDHLDRYPDERAYAMAKQRIYQHTDLCVWNRDDKATQPLSHQEGRQNIQFGSSDTNSGFGLQHTDASIAITHDGVFLLDIEQLPIQGLHNALNVQAAIALVMALGVDSATAARGVQGFQSLPHRCQLIAEHAGVRWVDDSKATNPGATIAALRGLRPTVAGKLILIAGGDAKGADLAVLQPELLHVDVLITLGRDGAKIASLKQDAWSVNSLAEAVACAAKHAVTGSMVLLSPACASLDMFKNYQDRGFQFKAAVESHYACI